MTLSTALSSAHSGLVSTSIRADVAASNIANATTPGYVRRTVSAQENVLGGKGVGVRATTIEREQDLGLSRARRDADSTVGRTSLVASAYASLNEALGVPGEDYGYFASLETLESAFKDLSATPESEALQNAVAAAIGDTATQFNQLGQSAKTMREDADRSIRSEVQTVNETLYALQQINRDLGSLNEQAGEAVAIEDERQRLIDKISSIIPIKDIPRDNGQVDIMTENGTFLLSGNVTELSFTPSNVLPNTLRYPNTGAFPSGVFIGTQEVTPGSGNQFSLTNGSLAGHFDVRDKIVPDFLDGIDALAGDLITRFSDDSLDPTKTPGDPGIFTDNGSAFDPLNTLGLADRISINSAIDPAQGGSPTRLRDGLGATTIGDVGDGTIITGLLNAMTATQAAPTGTTLTGDYSASGLSAGFASLISEQSLRYDAVNTGATARQNTLSDAELSRSAVDTDQELQSLLIIEQAYAANARVIQTVSDMIDRLLQI